MVKSARPYLFSFRFENVNKKTIFFHKTMAIGNLAWPTKYSINWLTDQLIDQPTDAHSYRGVWAQPKRNTLFPSNSYVRYAYFHWHKTFAKQCHTRLKLPPWQWENIRIWCFFISSSCLKTVKKSFMTLWAILECPTSQSLPSYGGGGKRKYLASKKWSYLNNLKIRSDYRFGNYSL